MMAMTKHQMALLASNQFGDLRDAGLTARDWRDAGWTARDWRVAGLTARDWRDVGLTASDMRDVGWTAHDLRDAGLTASDMRDAGFELGDIPFVERPYSRLLSDIKEQKRQFRQSTFGPSTLTTEDHICQTAMCTAGHLVNMAGAAGWKLQEQFGILAAARLIHDRAHPGWPCQNFGAIPDDWALAYIEEMAAREVAEAAQSGAPDHAP